MIQHEGARLRGKSCCFQPQWLNFFSSRRTNGLQTVRFHTGTPCIFKAPAAEPFATWEGLMTDTFTETTTKSWGSRIGDSIKGVLFGLVLIVGSGVFLFWHE